MFLYLPREPDPGRRLLIRQFRHQVTRTSERPEKEKTDTKKLITKRKDLLLGDRKKQRNTLPPLPNNLQPHEVVWKDWPSVHLNRDRIEKERRRKKQVQGRRRSCPVIVRLSTRTTYIPTYRSYSRALLHAHTHTPLSALLSSSRIRTYARTHTPPPPTHAVTNHDTRSCAYALRSTRIKSVFAQRIKTWL